MKAVAPAASAFTTSLPRRTPPSQMILVRPPTASTTGATSSIVAGDKLGSTEHMVEPATAPFSPVATATVVEYRRCMPGRISAPRWATAFHDLDDDRSRPAEVFRADLLALRAGTIAVAINCQMADLTDDALVSYGYRRHEVIDTPVNDYAITRRWGQHALGNDRLRRVGVEPPPKSRTAGVHAVYRPASGHLP